MIIKGGLRITNRNTVTKVLCCIKLEEYNILINQNYLLNSPHNCYRRLTQQPKSYLTAKHVNYSSYIAVDQTTCNSYIAVDYINHNSYILVVHINHNSYLSVEHINHNNYILVEYINHNN